MKVLYENHIFIIFLNLLTLAEIGDNVRKMLSINIECKCLLEVTLFRENLRSYGFVKKGPSDVILLNYFDFIR